MASLTPWAPQAGGTPTDGEAELLHLVAPPVGVDRDALRRSWARVPAPLRSQVVWLVLADVLLTGAVLALAARQVGARAVSPSTAVLIALLWCTALAASGAWSGSHRSAGLRTVFRAGVGAGLTCWAVDAAVDPEVTSAQLLALTVVLALAALLPRLLLLVAAGNRVVKVALAGDGDDVRRFLDELGRGPRGRWCVSAVCIDTDDAIGLSAAREHGVPVHGGIDEVVAAASSTGATAVLLAPGARLCPSTARRLSWDAQAAGLDVFLGTGLLDVAPTRATLVAGGDLGLVRLRSTTEPSFARAVKAVTERWLAALTILVLLPLLVTIAVAIRVDSRGGSLFRQTRVGRGERTFTMYKFRTMAVDAETRRASLTDANESDGVLFKMRSDPRVTRVGSLLRRYSLDELPQLVNVVLGHMSLVGPRPALPQEVALYDADPQHRLVVKPGLTGLWQVSGRSDLTWEESVRLDLHYVDNWRLTLDLMIVLRTVRAVLSHRGAY